MDFTDRFQYLRASLSADGNEVLEFGQAEPVEELVDSSYQSDLVATASKEDGLRAGCVIPLCQHRVMPKIRHVHIGKYP